VENQWEKGESEGKVNRSTSYTCMKVKNEICSKLFKKTVGVVQIVEWLPPKP
jgi:hypothetical protein